MITRRIFMGSTLGGVALGLPAKKIKGYAPIEEEPDPTIVGGPMKYGPMKSFRWELDEIIYLPDFWLGPPNEHLRYVEFPLEDKLHITYINKQHTTIETWSVFNWQIMGYPFDIVDFLNLPYIDFEHVNTGIPHKRYRDRNFYLYNIEVK